MLKPVASSAAMIDVVNVISLLQKITPPSALLVSIKDDDIYYKPQCRSAVMALVRPSFEEIPVQPGVQPCFSAAGCV